MKKTHRYCITVEHQEAVSAPLHFEAVSHDEIIGLVHRARQGDFDENTTAALIVGLKLLGEVMLQNRNHPLFEAFAPHYGQFIRRLKENVQAE